MWARTQSSKVYDWFIGEHLLSICIEQKLLQEQRTKLGLHWGWVDTGMWWAVERRGVQYVMTWAWK